jgi:adenylylsulfate kinase
MSRGRAFWVTGLPGSGKTTLALAAKKEIPGLVVLHMDEMRRVVTPEPTYSEEEREHLYRSLVFAALVMTREGRDVVIDATANRRSWRDLARKLIPEFHEIYVKCPLDVCREREKERVDAFAPKGIYKKGETGWPVPGVNVPYEEPVNPELVIDCDRLCVEEAGEVLVRYIKKTISA